MNWIDWELLAQNFFYGMITATVAGSVLVILVLFLERTSRYKDSRLKIFWMKTAQVLYLFPVMAFLVILTRTTISNQGVIAWTSDFWRASTLPMRNTYLSLMKIWMLGLLFGIIFRIFQYWKLHKILKGNIPVENDLCKRMIEEYQEKYELKRFTVYQNDLIDFPICVGDFHPKIVLPFRGYAEKELHMVLEHEICHIKSHDLLWKKVGLLTTFIHWWNPLAYILLQKLILQEEIECDIKTCENNNYFTMKEYGEYLSGMKGSQDDMIFVSALCKSKKDLFRRLEAIVRGKGYTKKIAVISCLILAMIATIPSYAAAEGVARMNETWMADTAEEIELESIDYSALEVTGHVSEEPNVEEIDLTLEQEILPFSTTVSLDRTINANTRVLYRWQSMQAGDQITIAAQCNDSSIVYRIGVRDSAGKLTYIQGSGNISHVFTIQASDSYTAYVENRSNTAMKVTGSATYLD